MPTYTYRCPDCGDKDITHSIHDAALTECAECGAPVKRLIGNPMVTFQGGRNFFRNTTIKTELEKGMQEIRDAGGTPEPIGKRWV
jgi:putative FmdB family regulatory protein